MRYFSSDENKINQMKNKKKVEISGKEWKKVEISGKEWKKWFGDFNHMIKKIIR